VIFLHDCFEPPRQTQLQPAFKQTAMQKVGIGPIDDAKIRNKIESTSLQLQFFHAKMNVRKATQQSLFVFLHRLIGLAISGRLQRHLRHFTA
jgi:hypothetical protein